MSRWSLQGFRGVSSLILDDRNEVETYMYMLTNDPASIIESVDSISRQGFFQKFLEEREDQSISTL